MRRKNQLERRRKETVMTYFEVVFPMLASRD
jgi:hypothetical protein